MDTGSILTLIGMGVAGLVGIVGAVWACGMYAGKLTTELKSIGEQLANGLKEMMELRRDHDRLRNDHDELAEKMRRRGDRT